MIESVCTYKGVNHVSVYCIFKLSWDIEKNPGPIDGNKTICAPYSQGNIEVFGDNASKQLCVAMSLCALIYNTSKPITGSVDLTEIMPIGNELYSILSSSISQTYLGRLHAVTMEEDIPNVMPPRVCCTKFNTTGL